MRTVPCQYGYELDLLLKPLQRAACNEPSLVRLLHVLLLPDLPVCWLLAACCWSWLQERLSLLAL
jgi:hypothetical protein